MTRLSMRARALLAAVAALVPVLAVASIAGVLVQRHDLTSSTTLVAREHARAVAGRLVDGAAPVSATAAGGGEDLVQVVRDGRVLAASGDLPRGAPLVASASAASTQLIGSVPGEGDRYVMVTAPVPQKRTYVVVARSLESVDAATTSTTWLLVAGSVLVIAIVGVLTWVLTGRALRPVDDMRRQAASITQANLSARLPTPGTGDELERLATTLNELLDRLEHALRTQRQFVADASHELRSPMAGLRAVLETAHLGADGAAGHAGETGYDADALRELARLELLVADLLLLARSEDRPPRRDLIDLAAEASALADRPGRMPVQLDAPSPAWIVGDRHALSRVIQNLLDNAQRHARSRITVAISSVHGTAGASGRRATAGAGRIRLVVADDGPGIPAADRERVFGRFVRLDEARARDDGGSGLGLAIVRQVVRDHGGTVTIADTAPGATVVVDLPQPEPPARSRADDPAGVAAMRRGN